MYWIEAVLFRVTEVGIEICMLHGTAVCTRCSQQHSEFLGFGEFFSSLNISLGLLPLQFNKQYVTIYSL